MTHDPLALLLDSAARQSAPARSNKELDADVARAVLVASARSARRKRWQFITTAAAVAVLATGMWGLRHEESHSAETPAFTRIELESDVVIAESGSALHSRARNGHREIVLENGIALFDVPPLAREESFVVHAGATEVEVRGTVFWVSHHGESVRVRVFEGRVEVRAPGILRMLDPGPAFEIESRSELEDLITSLDQEGERRARVRNNSLATLDDRSAAAIAEEPETTQIETPTSPRPRRCESHEPLTQVDIDTLRRWLSEGRFDEVLQALSNDSRISRDSDIALVEADAHRGAGHLAEAAARYERITSRLSPSRAAEIGYLSALLYSQSNETDRASAVLDATHADASGSPMEERATALRCRLDLRTDNARARTCARRYLAGFPGGFAAEEMQAMASVPLE